MPEPLVLGGASWNTMIYLDRFPAPEPATIANARSRAAAGSTGIGKALALKALGHEPLLHATIGDDDEGRRIREFLAGRGVATRFDIDPGGTSRHVNLMNALGERISIFLFNGSPEPPVDVAAIAPAITAAGTIFLNITQSSIPLIPLVQAARRAPREPLPHGQGGGPAKPAEVAGLDSMTAGTVRVAAPSTAPRAVPLPRAAHRRGLPTDGAEVWVDLHDYDGRNLYHRQFIEAADVLQLSDEALADPRAVMTDLSAGRRLVICTRGRHGALALDAGGEWHEVAPVPVTLVDSNGAGDTFMVAVWHALSRGDGPDAALAFAARMAGLAVESEELVPEKLTLEPHSKTI